MFSHLQVEMAIEKEATHLENIVDEYRVAATNAATAETDYKLAKAKSLYVAKIETPTMPVQILEAMSLSACEIPYRAHMLADAVLDATQKSFRACEARLDALRTLSAAHRSAGG